MGVSAGVCLTTDCITKKEEVVSKVGISVEGMSIVCRGFGTMRNSED